MHGDMGDSRAIRRLLRYLTGPDPLDHSDAMTSSTMTYPRCQSSRSAIGSA